MSHSARSTTHHSLPRRAAAAVVALACLVAPVAARAADGGPDSGTDGGPPCDGDYGAATANPCATTANPYCDVGGTCRRCVGNGDCASRATRPICNLTTGQCGATCATDTDCPSTHFCPTAGAVCTAKVANGDPIPIPPGPCTVVAGFRVCASFVCDLQPDGGTDNLCGYKKGTPCTNSAQCRVGGCSATDQRCGTPDGESCVEPSVCRSGNCVGGKCTLCSRDSDCGDLASGKVCAEPTFACVAGCRGTVGNHCPAGKQCTSTDTSVGQCVAPDAGGDASASDADALGASDSGSAGDGAGADAGGLPFDQGFMAGNGISCASVRPGAAGGGLSVAAVALALLARARRRRR